MQAVKALVRLDNFTGLSDLWDREKPVLTDHSQKDQNLVFKTNYCLMQLKSIEGEHSAILLTFI